VRWIISEQLNGRLKHATLQMAMISILYSEHLTVLYCNFICSDLFCWYPLLHSMKFYIWNTGILLWTNWKEPRKGFTWVWSTFPAAAWDVICAAEPCSWVTWSRWLRPPRPPCWSPGPSEEPSSRSGGDRWGSCCWLGGPPLLRPYGEKYNFFHFM
jgi:hypothetical protein